LTDYKVGAANCDQCYQLVYETIFFQIYQSSPKCMNVDPLPIVIIRLTLSVCCCPKVFTLSGFHFRTLFIILSSTLGAPTTWARPWYYQSLFRFTLFAQLCTTRFFYNPWNYHRSTSRLLLFHQVDSGAPFKLPTLGNHYKIKSVLDIFNSSDRKYSIPDERKISEISTSDLGDNQIVRNGRFHDQQEFSEIR
jgi:hypothetical protein